MHWTCIDAIRGTIDIRNSGLKPWTADNYDLSLEYYTAQGGVFSAPTIDHPPFSGPGRD